MAETFKFGSSTEIKYDPTIVLSQDKNSDNIQANADYQEYTQVKTYPTTYKWKIDSVGQVLDQKGCLKSKEFTLLPDKKQKVYLELYTEILADTSKSQPIIQSSQPNVFLYSSTPANAAGEKRTSNKKSLKMSLTVLQPAGKSLEVSVRYGVMNFNDRSVKLVQEVGNPSQYSNIIIDDIKNCKPSLEFFCEIKQAKVVTSQQDGPTSKYRFSLQDTLELLIGPDGVKQPDFEFICGDRKINVHRCVLKKQSAEFAALVQTKWKEAVTREVVIEDVCYEAMFEVVRFMYTGKIIDDDLLPELLKVAEKYNLKELKHECEDRLYENLVIENAMECLYLADFHNAQRLEKRVLHFIAMNKETVTETEGFKNFASKNSALSKIIHFL